MADIKICEFCGIVVDNKNYQKHLIMTHQTENLRCHFCGKEFKTSYNLKYHLAHHMNARNFVCDVHFCTKEYNTPADLARHKVKAHSGRDFKCDQCGLSLPNANRFNAHLKSHEGPSSRPPPTGLKTCSICKEEVANLNFHHRSVHQKLEPHRCQFCGKEFPRRSELTRHVGAVHLRLKPFKCEKFGCRRSFSSRSMLLRHLSTHNDDDPVVSTPNCTRCKIDVDDILKHFEDVHPLLFCKECSKTFSKNSRLTDHTKRYHSTERDFFCDYCSKGYISKKALKKHFKLHVDLPAAIKVENVESSESSKGPKNCPICNKVVKNLYSHNKVVHLKITNSKCRLCGKNYATKSGLDRHIRIIHRNSDSKEHKCHYKGCPAQFSDKSYLQRHLNKHKPPRYFGRLD